MARTVLLAKFERKRKQLFIVGGVFVVVIAALVSSSYFTIVAAQQSIIETEALRVANVVTEQAIVARSIYARSIVDRLSTSGVPVTHNFEDVKGALPIPAQFLKMMAHEANEKNLGLYRYKPLSRWNINPNQGLADDFQRWAFDELEKQREFAADRNKSLKPVWRIEEVFGERVLRFMTADLAVSSGRVS